MITDKDIARIYNERSIRCGSDVISGVGGTYSVYSKNGNLISSASLMYKRG